MDTLKKNYERSYTLKNLKEIVLWNSKKGPQDICGSKNKENDWVQCTGALDQAAP